jgi:hypothetical protein
VSSGNKQMFVTIGANTKFTCKKNMITKPKSDSLDSAVYNVFMELKMTKMILPLLSERKDPPNILALQEDNLIEVEQTLANNFDLFGFDNVIESTFVIESKGNNVYELVYIQVGPDSSDD